MANEVRPGQKLKGRNIRAPSGASRNAPSNKLSLRQNPCKPSCSPGRDELEVKGSMMQDGEKHLGTVPPQESTVETTNKDTLNVICGQQELDPFCFKLSMARDKKFCTAADKNHQCGRRHEAQIEIGLRSKVQNELKWLGTQLSQKIMGQIAQTVSACRNCTGRLCSMHAWDFEWAWPNIWNSQRNVGESSDNVGQLNNCVTGV
ncbi:hypothetical protein QAD02_017969 [Eretmocerus hayati]|uniref:Uncharacterized protein n=1 Tax=Eretmocerus hayati TaxID=131215 RepID=A0ACC2PFR2_9HYME|nr:hypothetical protein QAD02_017969 [Eretmocerus hayati]